MFGVDYKRWLFSGAHFLLWKSLVPTSNLRMILLKSFQIPIFTHQLRHVGHLLKGGGMMLIEIIDKRVRRQANHRLSRCAALSRCFRLCR